jgi:hypothetical protein
VGAGVDANQRAPNTTLRGWWLLAARASWVGVAALTLGLVTAGVVAALDRPDLMPQPSARAIFGHAGVPDQVTIVAFLIPTVTFAVTGLLIFWHRSNDWAAMLFALWLMTCSAIAIRTEWALELTMLIWSVFVGAGLYAQIHRYRRVSGPVQRRQTKWVALTLGLLFLVMLVGISVPSLFAAPSVWYLWALPAMVAACLLFAASVAIAILRHHLYDIDRLLSAP